MIAPAALHVAPDQFASLDEPQKMQLFGALTVAIWLDGHEIALPRGSASADCGADLLLPMAYSPHATRPDPWQAGGT